MVCLLHLHVLQTTASTVVYVKTFLISVSYPSCIVFGLSLALHDVTDMHLL